MSNSSDFDYSLFIQSLSPKAKATLYRDAASKLTTFIAYSVIIIPTLLGTATGLLLAFNFRPYGVEEILMITCMIGGPILGGAVSILMMGIIVRRAESRDINRYLNKHLGMTLTKCPSCNYDQSGTEGNDCPECGCRIRFR